MSSTYGLYEYSHWQGAGRGRMVAHGTKEQCEEAQSRLSTCSFCSPGRSQQYSTGQCYEVDKTRRPSGAELPEDVADWSASDLRDLIEKHMSWELDAEEDSFHRHGY